MVTEPQPEHSKPLEQEQPDADKFKARPNSVPLESWEGYRHGKPPPNLGAPLPNPIIASGATKEQAEEIQKKMKPSENIQTKYSIPLEGLQEQMKGVVEVLKNHSLVLAEIQEQIVRYAPIVGRVEVFKKQLKISDEFKRLFIEPSNRIENSLQAALRNPEKSKFYFAEAADTACRTLRKLKLDPDYLDIKEKLSVSSEYESSLDSVKEDLDQLLRFVGAEYDLLQASGLSKSLSATLALECMSAIKDVRDGQSKSQRMDEAIDQLQFESCSLANQLKNESQAERTREQQQLILRRILVGGIGTPILAIVNIAGITIPEFGPVFSGASILLAGQVALKFLDLAIKDSGLRT